MTVLSFSSHPSAASRAGSAGDENKIPLSRISSLPFRPFLVSIPVPFLPGCQAPLEAPAHTRASYVWRKQQQQSSSSSSGSSIHDGIHVAPWLRDLEILLSGCVSVRACYDVAFRGVANRLLPFSSLLLASWGLTPLFVLGCDSHHPTIRPPWPLQTVLPRVASPAPPTDKLPNLWCPPSRCHMSSVKLPLQRWRRLLLRHPLQLRRIPNWSR